MNVSTPRILFILSILLVCPSGFALLSTAAARRELELISIILNRLMEPNQFISKARTGPRQQTRIAGQTIQYERNLL